MAHRANVFCPFCNSGGQTQPILAPMSCVYVLAKTLGRDEDGSILTEDSDSHFEYRCPRCGYTEHQECILKEKQDD